MINYAWRTSHHILLYLTITLYVYINATLVRHDLNTGERLPEVITETMQIPGVLGNK
jgi:hypothetical protein